MSNYSRTKLAVVVISTVYLVQVTHSFAPLSVRRTQQQQLSTYSSTKLNNFFKNLVDQAFENDSNLSNDKSQGQLDDSYDDDDDNRPTLTAVQQQWRQGQNGASQKMVSQTLLAKGQWNMDFFLTGIPNKDPSNDLFGGRENISSRDRELGLSLPEEPTVADVTLTFSEDGVCEYTATTADDDNDFIVGNGEWRLSEDGKMVRFSLKVVGYTRTVVTKGSISKIYWSQEEDITRRTTTEYSIPPGFIFCDATIETDRRNGIIWKDAIVRVEKPMGLLGAASKMVPCGRFTAAPKLDEL